MTATDTPRIVELQVPTRPGLGLTLTEQARGWTREEAQAGARR